MKLVVVCFFFLFIHIGVASSGLSCYRYTPFVVKKSQDDTIEQTFATITTKSCKDDEQCSRLQITDAANKTYIALDCLHRSICQYPETWCQKLTDNLLKSCEITCCNGSLCADINKTKAVETKNPTIQKAPCSALTPFQVTFNPSEITEVYSQPKTKFCEMDERCGGIILKDKNNKTHKASACVNHNHCQNPSMFCKTLTHASNGTFVKCKLKCCNESLCLEDQMSNQRPSKCYKYSSFSLSGDEVNILQNTRVRLKTCNGDEVCSRATFTDKMNNKHLSLDCLPTSICKNPSKLCQYFNESNSQSPFVQCSIECCVDNLCYSESIPKSSSPASSSPSSPLSSPPSPSSSPPSPSSSPSSPSSSPSSGSSKPPTVATPSSTTKLQTFKGTILVAAIWLYICLKIHCNN